MKSSRRQRSENRKRRAAELEPAVEPGDETNWAYMVMVSLAWTLKAWFALLLPTRGRWREPHAMLRMEFRSLLLNFMLVPVQIVQTGRGLIYRLLAGHPWPLILLRASTALRC